MNTSSGSSQSQDEHRPQLIPEPSNVCTVNDHMLPFVILYAFVFLTGLAGGLLALWAFVRSHKAKRRTNVYLINLLISDFLLTLALPFKIAVDLGVAPWRLKIFHCQVSAVLIYINMYASIVFLAFVSADRYLRVTQSSRLCRVREAGFAGMMSAVVWALVLFVMVPNMAIPIRDVAEKPLVTCAEFKGELGRHWHMLTIFLCTAIFLNASAAVLVSNGLALRRLWGGRGGGPAERAAVRRAARSIAMVTLAYAVCFVPYHGVRMPYTLAQVQIIAGCPARRRLFLAKESTLLLAVMHLCFDPILYFYLSLSEQRLTTQEERSSRLDPETSAGHHSNTGANTGPLQGSQCQTDEREKAL